MQVFITIRERLERAWRALIDEPRDVAGIAGRADIILSGPLPQWMHKIYLAKAREMQRPLADVIYVALRVQAKQLIADAAEKTDSKKESL